MQVANEFMTFLYTLDNGQANLANVLLFGLNGLKDLVVNLITFQWVGWLVHLPQIRPSITQALIRENLFIGPEGWKDGTFSIFAILQDSPTTLGLNKFGVGILNSIFLMMPVTTASILAIRRLSMEGVNAWVAATLGTVVGEISFIACILFGGQSIIARWHFFGPFSYLAGFLLTLNVLLRMGLIVRTVPVRKILRDAFLVNFALSWLEQGTLLQKLQYFSWSAEQTNLLQRFNSSSPQEDLIIHLSYLLGLTIGCLSITAMVGYWLLYSLGIPWEQDQTGGALGLGVKGKLGIGRRGIGMKTKYRDLWSFRLVLIMASLALPYHGADYLTTSILGFMPRDPLTDNLPITDLKNDGENVFDLFFFDEGNWIESNNFVEEFRWRKSEREILKGVRRRLELRRDRLPDRLTEITKFPEIEDFATENLVSRKYPQPARDILADEPVPIPDDTLQAALNEVVEEGNGNGYDIQAKKNKFVRSSLSANVDPVTSKSESSSQTIKTPPRLGFLGATQEEPAAEPSRSKLSRTAARERAILEKRKEMRNSHNGFDGRTLAFQNRYKKKNNEMALPVPDNPFAIKDRKDWLEYKDQLDTARLAPVETEDINGEISQVIATNNLMLLPPSELKDFTRAARYNQRLFRTVDAPQTWKDDPINGDIYYLPKFFKRTGDFLARPYEFFKQGIVPERAYLKAVIDPPMFDKQSQVHFKNAFEKGSFWTNRTLQKQISSRIGQNALLNDKEKSDALSIGPLWSTAGRPMKQFLFKASKYQDFSQHFETQNTFSSYLGYRGLNFVNRFNNYPPIMATMRSMADGVLAGQPKSQFVTDEQKRKLQYHKAALARYNRSLRRYRESVNNHVISRLGNAKSKASYVYRQQFKGRYRVVRRLFFADAKRWNNPYNEPIFEYAQLLPADPTVSFRHEELDPVGPEPESLINTSHNFPWYFAWDEEARKTVLTTGTVAEKNRPSRDVSFGNVDGIQPVSIRAYDLELPTKVVETPWQAGWDPSFYARKTNYFLPPTAEKSLWTKLTDRLFGPLDKTIVEINAQFPASSMKTSKMGEDDLTEAIEKKEILLEKPNRRFITYRKPLSTRTPKG